MTVPLIGPVTAPELHVMTFNVRRRLGGLALRPADRWRARRPRMRALVRAERPTLLGVQEARPDQADAIRDALGAGYRFVGRGREAGGRGEGCPLFYDTERLQLLEWDQRALSDRPDVAGSRSWGNLLPRVVVRASFLDRVTGIRFTAINTHLDPFSQRSRVRSAREIRRLVTARPLPTVITGDLNARAGSATLTELLSDGTLRDAWSAAATRMTPEWDTYAGYRAPRQRKGRIDWIAASPDVGVMRAAINADTVEGGWASDHLPVQAVIRLTGPRGAS